MINSMICMGFDFRKKIDKQLFKGKLSADIFVWQRPEKISEHIYHGTYMWKTFYPIVNLYLDYQQLIEVTKKFGYQPDDYASFAMTAHKPDLELFYDCYREIDEGGKIWSETWFGNKVILGVDLQKNGWHFLGFDALDISAKISGLHGCGDLKEGEESFKFYAGCVMNQYGLFDNYADADQFARLRDDEIPQHASFYPVGLWVKNIFT